MVVGLLAAAFLSVRVYAHHSFAATYRLEDSIKIEGKVTQFQFRNPHSFVQVEAPDSKGVMRLWGVEWGGAGQLAAGVAPVNRYTLKAGDPVVITGNPARLETDYRMRMVTLLRKTDGLSWGQREGEVVD
jgi:hypothetical protein